MEMQVKNCEILKLTLKGLVEERGEIEIIMSFILIRTFDSIKMDGAWKLTALTLMERHEQLNVVHQEFMLFSH